MFSGHSCYKGLTLIPVLSLSFDQSDSPNGKTTPAVLLPLMASKLAKGKISPKVLLLHEAK